MSESILEDDEIDRVRSQAPARVAEEGEALSPAGGILTAAPNLARLRRALGHLWADVIALPAPRDGGAEDFDAKVRRASPFGVAHGRWLHGGVGKRALSGASSSGQTIARLP